MISTGIKVLVTVFQIQNYTSNKIIIIYQSNLPSETMCYVLFNFLTNGISTLTHNSYLPKFM